MPNIADRLEELTNSCIEEREKLKTERSAARQAAQELKAVLQQVKTERQEMEDGLLSLIESAVDSKMDRIAAKIVEEQGRSLRRVLSAVEVELRTLASG